MSCHSSAYGHLVFSDLDILTGSPPPQKSSLKYRRVIKKLEDLMNFWRCVTGSVKDISRPCVRMTRASLTELMAQWRR